MVNYPNAKKNVEKDDPEKAVLQHPEIKYPDGRKNTLKEQLISAGRRGMDLEKDINITNHAYLDDDIAVIHKKPTPVQIVKVDYPRRSAARITEAYFKIPSTTDYNGIYKAKYLDFEAKECHSATSFPLKSIHAHQIEHLDDVLRHGAIAFLLVRFTKFEETFFVPASLAISFYQTRERSSIPLRWFHEHGFIVSGSYRYPVNYLAVVDQLYFKEGIKKNGERK